MASGGRVSVKRIVNGRLGRWVVSVGVLLAVTSASCAAVSQSATDPQAEAVVAASPEADAITQIITAAHLADWGRRRGEPGPLIMAARMLGEAPLRPSEDAAGTAFLTSDALLNEALTMANGNQGVIDAVGRVRGVTRGVRSSPFGRGPIFMVREIKARETYGFELEARGGEVLRVAAIGDGDTNIDLQVRDAEGALICQDGRGDHYPVCTVVRSRPGKMRIDIVNRGSVWTKVQILSN